jgi:hypothetical protein
MARATGARGYAPRATDSDEENKNSRTAEQQNSRTAEQQNSRTAEQQNSRTAEQQRGRPAVPNGKWALPRP